MMQALEPAPTIEDERYDLAQTNAINALLIKTAVHASAACARVRRIVAHPARAASSRGTAGNCRDAAQLFRA